MRISGLPLIFLLVGCRIGFDELDEIDTLAAAAPLTDEVDETLYGFRGLCAFPRVTVIKNGIGADDVVGALLSSSLATGCGTGPATDTVSQDDPGVLDATGRPLFGPDDLVVIGGGDGPNRAIAYLLGADTPVMWSGTSNVQVWVRSTGRMIVEGPASDEHDYALVMLVTEPIGGSRILSAQGANTQGTRAAGFWFANRMAPSIESDTTTWVVVEWTNVDADKKPSSGDTFTVIESGS